MVLHISRLRRNVNRNVYNAEKCKRYNGTNNSTQHLSLPKQAGTCDVLETPLHEVQKVSIRALDSLSQVFGVGVALLTLAVCDAAWVTPGVYKQKTH